MQQTAVKEKERERGKREKKEEKWILSVGSEEERERKGEARERYLPYAPVIKFFERTIAECVQAGARN